MDSAIADKFCNDFGITKEQIKKYESIYTKEVIPVITRHYLSHLVITIEELINAKKKQAFLAEIKKHTANNIGDYTAIERAINRKMIRMFSIILAPVESGKLKARTHFIGGGTGALITYWKELPEDQIRILIAHELGHVAIKYLFDDARLAPNDGLATLFGYIALQDRNKFYKTRAQHFTRDRDMEIYDEISNICNRGNM